MSNRFSKPVSFNSTRDNDNIILNYVKRRNFSGFAKKAMLYYIENHPKQKPVEKPQQTPVQRVPSPTQKPQQKPLSTSERLARMKKQVNNGPKVFTPGGKNNA